MANDYSADETYKYVTAGAYTTNPMAGTWAYVTACFPVESNAAYTARAVAGKTLQLPVVVMEDGKDNVSGTDVIKWAAPALVNTHVGSFVSHLDDEPFACTVNEYENDIWEVPGVFGIEGFDLVWQVVDGQVQFKDIDSDWGNYAIYWGYENDAWFNYYAWNTTGGYSAYEVTDYNGSDIWFWSYNYRYGTENGGYDAIYWDLPEVLATYTGTYESGLQEEPYEVSIEELDNGMVRINDFYGYEGYPLYVDLNNYTPAVANHYASDNDYKYVSAGYTTDYVTACFKNTGASYTNSVIKGKILSLPVVVMQDGEDNVSHTDVIKWGESHALVAAHTGVYYSHVDDTNYPCTVNEYENDIWEVPSVFGIEGLDLVWQVVDGQVQFKDIDSTWSSYAIYWGYENGAWFNYYVWNTTGGYSAYEVTDYNGSDIWFWAYNYRNGGENGGYDAIYWDLPEVLATYTGTYESGLREEPYEVSIEELDNGMVRINDFYGYEGYPLYVNVTEGTPVVANDYASDDDYKYVSAGYTTDYVTACFPVDGEAIYTVGTIAGKTLQLPVVVMESGKDNVSYTDVIKWAAPALVTAHVGSFVSHLDDEPFACTVNEYENDLWEVPSVFGIEGLDLVWQVVNGQVQFKDIDSTWSNYAIYWGYENDAWFNYYVYNDNGGYSAYEVTDYNGSDIWFWAYNYRYGGENGGYDTIYWDLPAVEETYEGTYENGFAAAPYAVTVEELDNGKVRVLDFFGNEGYNLYLDLSGATPVIANAYSNDGTYSYLETGGWYYTDENLSDWAYECACFYNNYCTYTKFEDGSNEVNLANWVYRGENEDGVYHVDVLKWGGPQSGLEAIEDNSNEAPVYYNLQGMRVENPGAGLYIVKRGNSTSKVLVK